jgi:hypothetical protein
VADEPGRFSPELKRELQARLRGARRRGRPGNRRSELERLVDLTVLGSTHPELGNLLAVHGDDHALRAHRQGAGHLRSPARLEAPPRPDSGGQGAPPPLRCLRLLEPGPSGARHPCRESHREHEPEPKQHRHQEPSQDALPAWTPVRPGQHAGDAAWWSSLPGLQSCSAATVPGTIQDSPSE